MYGMQSDRTEEEARRQVKEEALREPVKKAGAGTGWQIPLLSRQKEAVLPVISHIRKRHGGGQEAAFMPHCLFLGAPGSGRGALAYELVRILESSFPVSVTEVSLKELIQGDPQRLFPERRKDGGLRAVFVRSVYGERVPPSFSGPVMRGKALAVFFADGMDAFEGFSGRNRELCCHIARHVQFPAYKKGELMDIFSHLLLREGYPVSDEARRKALALFRDGDDAYAAVSLFGEVLMRAEAEAADEISLRCMPERIKRF